MCNSDFSFRIHFWVKGLLTQKPSAFLKVDAWSPGISVSSWNWKSWQWNKDDDNSDKSGEPFLRTRYVTGVYIYHFTPLPNSQLIHSWLFPFYRCGNWGWKRLSNSPRAHSQWRKAGLRTKLPKLSPTMPCSVSCHIECKRFLWFAVLSFKLDDWYCF